MHPLLSVWYFQPWSKNLYLLYITSLRKWFQCSCWCHVSITFAIKFSDCRHMQGGGRRRCGGIVDWRQRSRWRQDENFNANCDWDGTPVVPPASKGARLPLTRSCAAFTLPLLYNIFVPWCEHYAAGNEDFHADRSRFFWRKKYLHSKFRHGCRYFCSNENQDWMDWNRKSPCVSISAEMVGCISR